MSYLPIPEHGKFYDLNIPVDNLKVTRKRLTRLVQIGYEVVALTKYWECSKVSSKGREKIVVPKPPEKIEETTEIRKILQTKNQSLTQLTRLTIELRELADVIKVREAINSGMYDVLAVHPHSDKLFHACCKDQNIDIICIDGLNRLSFIPHHTPIKCALSRGIYFETCYSPMIRDSDARRVAITNTQKILQTASGKNFILSSGGGQALEIRAPYDVANLNCLFGTKESTYLDTISRHCRAVVVHGFCRKTAKGAIYIEKMPQTVCEQNSEDKVGKIIQKATDEEVVNDCVSDSILNTPKEDASNLSSCSVVPTSDSKPSKKKRTLSSRKGDERSPKKKMKRIS